MLANLSRGPPRPEEIMKLYHSHSHSVHCPVNIRFSVKKEIEWSSLFDIDIEVLWRTIIGPFMYE